jgi:hypothetical protein
LKAKGKLKPKQIVVAAMRKLLVSVLRCSENRQTLRSGVGHGLFCAHCFRPGGILSDGTNSLVRFLLGPIVVGVGELADAMIAGATDASLYGRWPIVGNNDIKLLARSRKRPASPAA